MSPSCLALVAARGGSKAIPGKNLAPVAGRPLIAWTLDTAARARGLDRVVVTTDSPEIARAATSHGADVPFLRPAELARDDTPGIDPVLHAVRWLDENEDYRSDLVMLLQPTSPLRSAGDIEAAIGLLAERDADAVIGVTPAEHHPYWTKQLYDNGRLGDFMELEDVPTRRQDLPPAYAINGAMFLIRRSVLLEREDWYTDKTYAYVMPPERSLDVDSLWHLRLVDLILQHESRATID